MDLKIPFRLTHLRTLKYALAVSFLLHVAGFLVLAWTGFDPFHVEIREIPVTLQAVLPEEKKKTVDPEREKSRPEEVTPPDPSASRPDEAGKNPDTPAPARRPARPMPPVSTPAASPGSAGSPQPRKLAEVRDPQGPSPARAVNLQRSNPQPRSAEPIHPETLSPKPGPARRAPLVSPPTNHYPDGPSSRADIQPLAPSRERISVQRATPAKDRASARPSRIEVAAAARVKSPRTLSWEESVSRSRTPQIRAPQRKEDSGKKVTPLPPPEPVQIPGKSARPMPRQVQSAPVSTARAAIQPAAPSSFSADAVRKMKPAARVELSGSPAPSPPRRGLQVRSAHPLSVPSGTPVKRVAESSGGPVPNRPSVKLRTVAGTQEMSPLQTPGRASRVAIKRGGKDRSKAHPRSPASGPVLNRLRALTSTPAIGSSAPRKRPSSGRPVPMQVAAIPPDFIEEKPEAGSGSEASFAEEGNEPNPELETVRRAFSTQVWKKIAEAKFYPGIARDRGYEGQPVVAFTLNRRGELLELNLEKPSGYSVLDEAALQAVKAARPYPNIPKLLKTNSIRFKLPVSFILEKP